jgi:hypothetical protein
MPLEEARLAGDVLRQRFENAVLEYQFLLPAHLAVQLGPIGRDYLAGLPSESLRSLAPISPTATAPVAGPSLTLRVEIQVQYPVLPLDRPQVLTMSVYDSQGAPQEGVVLLVVLRGPRSEVSPAFPPTATDGVTRLEVVVPDLLPGEIVNFEVLATSASGMGYAFGQYAVRAP